MTVLLVSFSFILSVKAQTSFCHRFGMGAGSVELNPYGQYASMNNEPIWKFNTVFKMNLYNHSAIPSAMLKKTSSYSTPVFYYEGSFSQRSALRMSYQYSNEKGHVSDLFQNEKAEPAVFHYAFRQHTLNSGYSYTFLFKQHIQLYVASDIETVIRQLNENPILYNGGGCLINEYVDESKTTSRTQLAIFLNQILGVSLPISKQVIVCYECAGKFVAGDVRLKPVNSLSVMYSF